MKLWILRPGYVSSKHDVDEHYISEAALCDLYGVRRNECVTLNDAGRVHGMSDEIQDALVTLSPRYDGYQLPVAYETQRSFMTTVLARIEQRRREEKWVGIPVKNEAGDIVGRVIEAKMCYHPDSAQIICEVEPSFARYLTSSMKGSFSVGTS